MVPFESLGAVSYLPSIVNMAVSCISSEIKQDIGGKSSSFSIPPLHSTPPLGGFPSEYFHSIWSGKTRMVGLQNGKENFEDMYNHLDTIPACDGQTDRETSCHGIVRAMHSRRVVM